MYYSESRWGGLALSLLYILPLFLLIQIPTIRFNVQGWLGFVCLVGVAAYVVMTGLLGSNRLRPRPSDLLLLLVLGGVFYSALIQEDWSLTLVSAGTWGQVAVLYLLARSLLSPALSRATFEWLLVLSGCALALGFLVDMAGLIEVQNIWPFYPFNTLRNYLAQMLVLPLACALVLLVRVKRRWLLLLLPLAILTMAILVTRSRAVWLGLVFAGVVLLAGWLLLRDQDQPRRSGRLMVAGVVMVLAIAAVQWGAPRVGLPAPVETLQTLEDLDAGSAGGRLRRWENALELVTRQPWQGVGPGRWAEAFEPYRDKNEIDPPGYPLPFNSFILLAGEAGMVTCLLLILWLAALLLRRGDNATSIYRAAVVCLLVAAFFHSTFTARLPFYNLFLALGLLAATHPNKVIASTRLSLPFWLVVLGGLLVMAPSETRMAGASIGYATLDDSLRNNPRWQFARYYYRQRLHKLPGAERVVPLLDDDSIQNQVEFIERYGPDRQSNPYLLLARGLDNRQPVDRAELFERALTRSPTDRDIYRRFCRFLLESNHHRKIEDICQRGLDLHPLDPWLLVTFAQSLEQRGNQHEANQLLATARDSIETRLDTPAIGLRGQRLHNALRSLRADIRVLVADNGEPGRRLDATLSVPLLHKRIVLDGDDVLFASNQSGRYELWRQGRGESAQRLSNDEWSYFRPWLDVRHRYLYFLSDDRGNGSFALYRRHLDSGDISLISTTDANDSVTNYALSGDGSRIAYTASRGIYHRLELVRANVEQVRVLSDATAVLGHLAWHPEGNHIVIVENQRTLLGLDVQTGNRITLMKGDAPVYDPSYSPNGERLVFVERDRHGHSKLWLFNAGNTSQRFLLLDQPEAIYQPQWIDNQRLLLRVRKNDEYTTSIFHVGAITQEQLSPDTGVVYKPEPYLWPPGETRMAAVWANQEDPAMIADLFVDPPGSRVRWRPNRDRSLSSLLMRREVIRSPDGDIATYRIDPPLPSSGFDSKPAVVVWLHGGGGALSPRWHPYAQFFASSGYTFVGINYEGVNHERGSEARRLSAVDTVLSALEAGGRVDDRNIFIVGVSTGSALGRQFQERYPGRVAALVEYAPLGGRRDNRPGETPRLLIWGENDQYLSRARIGLAAISPELDDRMIQHVVLANEGHDIRRPFNIKKRGLMTLDFLQRHLR